MIQLTVGYVAGIIAAAIFVARLWSPNTLTFVLSGLLRDRSSAATLTVASRAFHRSHWPDVLRADSVLNHGVRKDVLLVTKLISFMGALIALAGVITPLGLFEALVPAENTETPFQYLKDLSPFGYGTPPRTNLTFNRQCGYFGLVPCPFTDTVAIVTQDDTGAVNFTYPSGYNINIPDIISEIYSSGTDDKTTISNYFDIQWRRYVTKSDKQFNNGSLYLASAFRNMDSLILNNAMQPVEGLIVDTVNGGIGLRNHTIPPGFHYGVTWEEDLLFIEPETVCVDTNLTLDYSTPLSPNISTQIIDLVLTDRGGFINLNQIYPEPDLSDPQKNADLFGRAYKAAWLNNVWTALYFNVTDSNNSTKGTHAFSYLNSELGKTYPLPPPIDGVIGGFDSLVLTVNYGDYLQLTYGGSTPGIANTSSPADSAPPSNPFNVNIGNFSDINILCTGAGGADYANITNIYVACGLMHGVPQRQDSGSSLVFDSGSRWSQPLYSCASAVKATIKTVSFNYNGTDGTLQNLAVTDIQDKTYPDSSSIPLWGVEDTGNGYYMRDMNLIWGLVSSHWGNHENVTTVRQQSLYLPGYSQGGSTTQYSIGSENLPGSDFFSGAMGTAYSVSAGDIGTGGLDYSGATNMAMWAQWQNLTKSTKTAAIIPNLIFTDNAAAAVVGIKGVLGPGNTAQKNLVPLAVTPTVSKIKYHYLFAIPALTAGLLLVLITLVAFVTVCLGRGGIGRMRLHLQQLSPGRIFTTFLYPEQGGMTIRSKDWNRQMGKKMIDLSREYPLAADVMLPPEKGFRITEHQRSGSDDRSAEGERLVNSPGHARETSQGDIGGYGYAQPQEYGVIHPPPGPGFETGR